jgi:hypothetical protein
MPVPFMIEIDHDAATQQAHSCWVSLTPTEAKVATLVEEGLSNAEIATLWLSWRIVATTSGICCGSSAHSRIDIVREPALRAAASR